MTRCIVKHSCIVMYYLFWKCIVSLQDFYCAKLNDVKVNMIEQSMRNEYSSTNRSLEELPMATATHTGAQPTNSRLQLLSCGSDGLTPIIHIRYETFTVYINSRCPWFVLTWVESLEARVISRLPLRPRRGGTRITTSETFVKTGQCYRNTEQHILNRETCLPSYKINPYI